MRGVCILLLQVFTCYTCVTGNIHLTDLNPDEDQTRCEIDLTTSGDDQISMRYIAKPLPGEYITCKWLVTVDDSQIVRTVISNLHIEESNDCTSASLKLYNTQDSEPPPLLTSCGSQNPKNAIRSTGPEVLVVYEVFETTDTNPGFDIKFSEIFQSGECGHTTVEFELNRIVNGRSVTPHTFPWMVEILYHPPVFDHHGGGSIIAKHWIVTAAHVLNDSNTSDYLVVISEHDRTNKNQWQREVVPYRFHKHPKYLSHIEKNDIALIELEHGIDYNHVRSPICLPQIPSAVDQDPYLIAVTIGWGFTKWWRSRFPGVLQQVTVVGMDLKKCQTNYNEIDTTRVVIETNICANDPNIGGDSCGGDSGGPLMISINQKWILVGITSWGIDQCGERSFPGVYTRVSSYRNWISETTGIIY